MTDRKSELSLMNILMCLLVIFVHVCSWSINILDKTSIKYLFIMAPYKLSYFVVQGFIFLSAVKLFSSLKPFDYEKFLVGRYKKIVLPYILWVIIYYVYFINHELYRYVFSWDSLGQFLFFGTIASHFYFVIVIMQFYFNMPLFKWLTSKVNGAVLAVMSVVFTALFKQYVHFQYDDRVFPAYLCYFVIGAVVGRNYEKVCAFIRRIWWLLGIGFILLGAGNVILTYRGVMGNPFAYIEIYHLFYCLFAIFFFFALFRRFFGGKRLWGAVSLLDRSSYLIYLSHVLFIYIANSVIDNSGITNMLYAFLIRFAVAFGGTLSTCMVYTFIKEKILNARKASRTV